MQKLGGTSTLRRLGSIPFYPIQYNGLLIVFKQQNFLKLARITRVRWIDRIQLCQK